MSEIVPHAHLMVIAEAPGMNEVNEGRPLIGKSGQATVTALNDGGLAREDCALANVCCCRPPEEFKAYEYRLQVAHEAACERARAEGRPEPTPPLMPSEACFPRLQRDLEEARAPVVLTLGSAALQAVAKHGDVPYGSARKVKSGDVRIGSLKKQLGSPVTMRDGTIVLPTYHPAFAMRAGSRQYQHVIREHISRAARIAIRGHVDWKEPPFILEPSVEQIEQTLERIRVSGVIVAVDIETDKGTRPDGEFDPFSCRLRCIGFAAKIIDEANNEEEVVIVVPIRRIDGGEWWADITDKRRVVQACMNVLNSNPLVGHNFAFDSGVLLRCGLLVDRQREHEDSLLLHHDTADNDLPHDLGFVASRYFEVPAWKSGADDKYYEQVTDYDLHLYNLRDALITLRLYFRLIDDVYRYGTIAQYELDRKMMPIARDMGELGLFIDERKRGELSLSLNKEAHDRMMKLKDLVGDPKFNPNSPPQIRRYLFQTKKHVPLSNTQGKDWAEGEDPSTNTGALTKLTQQQGCDDETKKFINTLLEFRAFTKLRGTYVDNLRVTYEDWSKYGYTLPMVPEVRGPQWTKFKKRERAEMAQQRWPDEWAEAACVPQGLPKKEAKAARADARRRLEVLVARVEDGVWEEVVIIPERPALSRLHITYKLHVVPSGRMSSTPNCQNLPKFGKANTHEMIVCPPGDHVIVGADLDQVELRLYAAIAGDKLLLKAFKNGMDPHSYNAASLFAKRAGKSVDAMYEWIVGLPDSTAKTYVDAAREKAKKEGREATDEEVSKAHDTGFKKGEKEKKKLRGYAKTFAYLEAYGGEADRLFSFMSTARDKATGALMFPDLKEDDVYEWHDAWHKTHPETKSWQETCQRIARLEGYTCAPIGSYRKRFFMGGPNKPGATFNHVIQGAAAEIANRALVQIAEKVPFRSWSPFTGLCLQIHDYIGLYCPRDRAEEAKKIIEEALCCEVFGIKITATAVISDGLATQ